VQRDSVVLLVWIRDAVQSKLVRHVCNLVGLIRLLGDDLHVVILGVVEIDCRPGVACLGQTTLQDLHDAVGVGVALSCQLYPNRSYGDEERSMMSTMLTKKQAAQEIESGVLTGCLLRCGRIDLLIGEQSRFVSQEYRAFNCAVQSKARSHSDLLSIEREQRKADLLVNGTRPTGCPH